MMTKQQLRLELLALRKEIAPGQRQIWDSAIQQAVCALDWFQQAGAILGYYPIGSEPDLRPVLREALRLGKTVALPRCNPGTKEMAFHRVGSLEGLAPGAHGIPEPDAGAETVSGDLCLVPGIAFDLAGYRLGYGGGYYDRFLPRFGGHSLGVCYDALLCGALPHEPHDIAVGSVMTELTEKRSLL